MRARKIREYNRRQNLIGEIQSAGNYILSKGKNPVFVKEIITLDDANDYDLCIEIIKQARFLTNNGINPRFVRTENAKKGRYKGREPRNDYAEK